jgi:hypothetical protein
MRKLPLLLCAVVMLMTSCQPKPETVVVDPEAIKTELNNFMDEYNVAYKSMDINKMTALCTDNVLFLGSDPSEFWSKKQMTDYITSQGLDTIKLEFVIDRREILVAADGNSAIVVEQFLMPLVSPNMAVRSIDHIVKVGDGWKFDLISWNVIPRNEDIPKLNAAFEEAAK